VNENIYCQQNNSYIETDRSFCNFRNSTAILMHEEKNDVEPLVEEELEILEFLNRAAEKLNRKLQKTYIQAKDIMKMDKANKKLGK